MHMGKRIVAIMLSILFCIAGTASAEMKDFHGTGEYTMSKYETPAVAEERAVQEAERDALEQAGVYVESYTKTENMQVKKDTITVLTNGILKITKRDITTTTTPTGEIRFKAEITASIDTDDINKNLKDTAAMEKLQEKYDALQEEYQKQADELKQAQKTVSSRVVKDAVKRHQKQNMIDNQIKNILDKNIWTEETYNPSLALEELNKLFEVDSSYAHLYWSRALVERELKAYSDAIQDYTMAINLSLDNPFTSYCYLFDRAKVYGKVHSYAKAVKDYSQYIEKYPKDWKAYRFRGWAYYSLDQYDNAIADAEAGMAAYSQMLGEEREIAPADTQLLFWTNEQLLADYHVLKADSLQAQGKYQEAIEWYTKSIELNPKNPNYYFARAWTEGISNDYVSAISDYKMYLKYDPEDQEGRTEAAYTDISFAYAVLTQYEKSIEYADKALALNPNNKDAQLWKKKSLEALGRW